MSEQRCPYTQPGRAPNRNGGARQFDWFFETLGDRADAASGKETLHPHRWRERRGEMDLAASPRRTSPRKGIPHRARAEKEDEPREGESSSGRGFPTKTAPQENGAEFEAGSRSQRRAARGETFGNPSPAPEGTGAIDPASRSGGTRRPSGAGHRVDTAATTSTSQSDVARRYDAATATCNAPRRSGARQSGGGYRHGDTSTFKGTRRPRSAQAKRARRQDRAAAFHSPRRPCSRQLGGARRHDAASAVFRGPGRPGSR